MSGDRMSDYHQIGNNDSGWYGKNLGDAMLADPALEQVQASFGAALTKELVSEGMALFMRHESEGQLHCDVKVYFSPAAARLALALGAARCPKPGKRGLALLAGDPNIWAQLED